MFDKKVKETIFKYKCSNYNNNQFILLLQKAFYPYEYMADYGKTQ